MKLYIDNIDGFNAIFKTSYNSTCSIPNLYEVNLEDLKLSKWSQFWKIAESSFCCRRFSVLTEDQFNKVTKDELTN